MSIEDTFFKKLKGLKPDDLKGSIRTKQKCKKCGIRFTPHMLTCDRCSTSPTKYFIDIHHKGCGRIQIHQDQKGNPLDSLAAAQRILLNIRYEMQEHIFDPSMYIKSGTAPYRFETRVKVWHEEKKREQEIGNLSESYVKMLERFMNMYFISHFHGRDVREIRTLHIKDFYLKLPTKLNLKYRKNILGALENFFITLMKDEIIQRRPQFPKVTLDRVPPKWVNLKTQMAILGSIAPEDRPIFHFMCFQGVRPSEARALKVKDLNLADGVVIISRTFSYHKLRERTKSKIVRPRLLNPMLLPMLTEACRDKTPEAFVFTNPRRKGRPYGDNVIDKIWGKVRTQLNLDCTLYQATRHSLASIALNAGAPLTAIQGLLGHTDLKTTQKYAHPNLKMQEAAFKVHAEILSISDEKVGATWGQRGKNH